MKRKDFYIGQKLVVVGNGGGMSADIGDVVEVSDIGNGYVYVEGYEKDSGQGQKYTQFKPYVEPTPTFEELVNEYSIVVKTGKCTTTFNGSLTNAQILEVMNIFKKGK